MFNIEIKNYGYNMYSERRMKTEAGREITVHIICVQICKLKSTARTDYYKS